jgi:drug/metabolite transporter (DMT)-like permease
MEWYVFAIIGAILTSAAAITQKKTLIKEHAMEFSAVLALFNFFITIPFWFTIEWALFDIMMLLAMYGVSIIAAFAFLFIAKSIRHMELSTATPLFGGGPLFILLISIIFLKESVTWVQFGGIMLIVLGSYTIELKRHVSILEPFKIFVKSKYVHFIIYATILYAITANFDRYFLSVRGIPPTSYITIMHFFLACNFMLLIAIFYDGYDGVVRGIKKAGKWIFILSVLVTGYRFAQLTAVQSISAVFVVSIKRVSTLLTTLIGGELFHETNIIRKTVASVIIIAGALLIIL